MYEEFRAWHIKRILALDAERRERCERMGVQYLPRVSDSDYTPWQSRDRFTKEAWRSYGKTKIYPTYSIKVTGVGELDKDYTFIVRLTLGKAGVKREAHVLMYAGDCQGYDDLIEWFRYRVKQELDKTKLQLKQP